MPGEKGKNIWLFEIDIMILNTEQLWYFVNWFSEEGNVYMTYMYSPHIYEYYLILFCFPRDFYIILQILLFLN